MPAVVPPVTTPVDGLTAAIVLPEATLQLPGVEMSLRVMLACWHTTGVPVMLDGNAFTNTETPTAQPVESVYEITWGPAARPVMVPSVALAAVATVLPPLSGLQVPPLVPSVSTVVCPAQTTGVPPIAAGCGLTVIVAVVLHPVVVSV